MSIKRSIVWVLMLALLLPILAACGGGTAGETTTGGETSAAASAAGEEPAEASEEAAEESAEASEEGAEASEEGAEASAEASEEGTEASAAASGAGTEASAAASGAATEGGAGAAAPNLEAIPVEEGAVLRVASWGNESEQAINQASFERFNEIFPNVEIQYEPRPDQYQTSIQADFAGGTNPDVMYIDSALQNQLAPNGLLLDLAPYMEQAGVSRDEYIGQLSEIFVLENTVTGLPKDQGALALFVRNDLAEAAGIDPASIQTWDDWAAAAEAMTTDGVYGQCTSFDPQRVGALMLQNGVTPVTDGTANFADPAAVEAVTFWKGLVDAGHATLPREVGADWCGQWFGQGQTAMVMEGGWMLPYLEQDFADVEYTALPIPTPPDGEQASLVFTNAWGAAANTQYPNAAAALVLYLTSAANQQPILETGFALPTVESLLEDPYFEQNPNARVLAEAGGYGSPADIVFGGAKKDDVINQINLALEGVWTGGGEVQAALEQANTEAQAVLDAE